jgi:acetyl/propionyl-CoA carboxylase alpha subunit
MIKRLLIANRGEIALRIVRACRELDIESVAVFSAADVNAPHVVAADRAVALGSAPASDSYLSIPKLIAAAQSHSADAVHPGYGFLSENAAFAAACETAGLTFVGPPSDVIARMGSKIEARRLMLSAGIPVAPGETSDDQSDRGLEKTLGRVGLPALIKASAGGGGKGMREVRDWAEGIAAIQSARREAAAAFGDGTLYVERLLDRPRHIEVQIFADQHGAVTHLFERDCSIQRRHQKVIEESPSTALTPVLRERITSAAVAAARAAEYRNAGTVEFLLEGRGDSAVFYFLEMNTRLQVEHGVTEAVTGLDLVRAQLLVASGQPLPWNETPTQRGHCIEARIYAEDPAHDFLPQAGPLLLYREPRMPGVRIDSGVREGGEAHVHYDPLLAKVMAFGEHRDAAIARLLAALRDFPILGVATNVPFLINVLQHPQFRAGELDTGFLDRQGQTLTARAGLPDFLREALTDMDNSVDNRGPAPSSPQPAAAEDPWSTLSGWRM